MIRRLIDYFINWSWKNALKSGRYNFPQKTQIFN